MNERDLMRRAIKVAQVGIAAGQSPFGAVIVRAGNIVAETHNTVWRDLDPTAHAEVNCIRRAAAALGTIDLSGCILYSTCEPCPMCLSATHWSKIDRVIYGASIADAASAGFQELHVPASDLVRLGRSPLRVEPGLLEDECVALFDQWKQAGLCQSY
jgi:guanine deaminase